ncbi:MAG: gamma-glutamyltransferase [Acidobacteria bacterium]|nr:gamma-glutamyltransferase [Acidobacteriota bacterium]
MVMTQRGIVAASQTLASQAGAQILARGGSAVDAAIAANAVLGLVEPMMCGIGGDLFAMYWDAKTGKLTGINASGWSPEHLTIEYLKAHDHWSMPSTGIHTVTVPGAVDGWFRMHQRFGKLPWRDLFQPAIYYARHGFPVTEIIQYDWDETTAKLARDANASAVFLKDGRAPAAGEIFRNPGLAAAYELIAAQGPSAYYRGAITQAILETSKRLGGTLTAADFADFQSEWVTPISTDYRGWKVFQLPPNGQGIGTLEMLNLMEQFPLPEYGQNTAEAFHYKIESQKLAYQDLRRYVGDPRKVKVPVEGMLSKEYARERAKLVDPKQARCDASPGTPPGVGHTVYLSAIDADGNIASWIQSISDIWGSGVVVDRYGFSLHDRGGGFSVDPSQPNALAPHKRPFHTIIPGFMEKGDLHIGFGIMRGSNQPQAQAQFVSNVVDHRMNIQAALEAPRFTRATLGGCEVFIEGRATQAAQEELTRRGHRLSVGGEYSGLVGGGQAVMRDSKNRVNYGGSSPRKDGAAIPEPDPYFGAAAKSK